VTTIDLECTGLMTFAGRPSGPRDEPAYDSSARRMTATVVRDLPVLRIEQPALRSFRHGRYTILREIGSGAMATVYAAYDRQLDRKIAIKVIRDRRTRGQREAQASAKIRHPNVVQIHETGTHNGQDFIAMELVEGVTLTAWQSQRRRNVYDTLAIYAQAGRGLAAAHRAGIVHRDFKPDNVIVDAHGHPRVTDFGLARLVDAPAERPRVVVAPLPAGECSTQRDTLVGTPAYMAPEQFVRADVDSRADQFSLCAALYEAVYGVRPIAGETVEELRLNAQAGCIQAPTEQRPAPAALHAVLLRGLALDPDDRWPSVDELVDRLDALTEQLAWPSVHELVDGLAAFQGHSAPPRPRVRPPLVIIAALCAAFGVPAGLRLGEAAKERWALLAVSVASSLVVSLMVLLARRAIQGDELRRRLLALTLVGGLGSVFTRALALASRYSLEQTLVFEMSELGLLCLAAAPLIAPVLGVGCGILWSAAIAVALGAPALPTTALAATLVAVPFLVAWSSSSTADA
jgi:predicted Ser/Thr protein kinase